VLKTGLNCNYFSKAMERGLIVENFRGSLAKVRGEPVRAILGRWIWI
jgi:hypothetical protein